MLGSVGFVGETLGLLGDVWSPKKNFRDTKPTQIKLAVVQTAPSSVPNLTSLLELVPSILQGGSENMKIVFQIMECYLLTGKKLNTAYSGPCKVSIFHPMLHQRNERINVVELGSLKLARIRNGKRSVLHAVVLIKLMTYLFRQLE